MTYRINGKRVTHEEFMANARGLDFSSSPINILSDIKPYKCPVTGRMIEGRSAHRENLKSTGCRLLEPGEREHYEREKPKEIERNAERTADFLSDRIAERWGE